MLNKQNVYFSPTNQQKNYTLFLKMQYAVQNTENYDTYELMRQLKQLKLALLGIKVKKVVIVQHV